MGICRKEWYILKNERQGEKLRKLLKERGLNVPELHRQTDIPTNTLYDWFNGRVAPKASTVKAVAVELEVSADELID